MAKKKKLTDKERLKAAKSSYKSLDKRRDKLYERQEKLGVEDSRYDDIEEHIAELADAINEQEQVMFEFQDLPDLKKKYEGKYFKRENSKERDCVTDIYIYVKEVLATFENENQFIGIFIEKTKEDNKYVFHLREVNSINCDMSTFLTGYFEKSSKEEFDGLAHKIMSDIHTELGVSTGTEDIDKMKADLAEANSNLRKMTRKHNQVLKAGENIASEREKLRMQKLACETFICENTFITLKKRSVLAKKITRLGR